VSDDIHEQCLNELVATTKGLKLGLDVRARRLDHEISSDGRITIQHWEKGITFFPLQEQESSNETISRNDIGYGCGCLIALGNETSLSANLGRAPEIRAKIRRKFIDQKLFKVSIVGGYYLTTKVSHLQINQPREGHHWEASSLLIRCWVREPRG
jgi:hypothetical protein